MNDKFIKEDYVLGNKKIVVGDNLHDLVLENLGKIWIRYGNSYKDFQSFISQVAKSTNDFSKVIIEPTGRQDPSKYKSGALVFDVRTGTLHLKYQNELLLLLEYDSSLKDKAGDKMTGPLEIYYDGVPLKVKSAQLVKNLNVEYLQGKTPDDFAQKEKDEIINGNWIFNGQDVHNGHNDFNNSVDINGELEVNAEATFNGKTHFYNETDFTKTATFKNSNTAIRVGTGDIITDGSVGSSQFMSGMTGCGWRLDASTNTLTIDNLIVRGVLNVFESVVNKISATNGSFWITDSFKIDQLHDVTYLIDSEYSNFAATKSSIDELFNEENYYIPACTNYKTTETPDKTTHPYATRDEQSPEGDRTPTFDFFKWIFKILKLDEFKEMLIPVVTTSTEEKEEKITLQEYLNELSRTGIEYYIDESNLIRLLSDFEDGTLLNKFSEIPETEAVESNEEANPYIYINNDKLTVTLEKENGMGVENLERNITIMHYVKVSTTIPATLTISDLFTESKLLELAAEEYIELSHIFQKEPTKANELEEIVGSNLGIFPDGKELFANQLFTIVNSSSAVLNNGYYTFEDSAISKINLYYKYFGSNLDNGMNLYILESDHNEYPVFKPGDILKCQKFTGTSVEQYHALVLGLAGQYSFIVQLQNYSIIQEGVSYSYNESGELTRTQLNIDPSLYSRSEGLIVDLNDYLSQARNLLLKYADGDESITQSQIHWCLQVLLPEESVQNYEDDLLAASTAGEISNEVDIILSNSISGMSLQEVADHPVFKKALEDSTSGIPAKGDSLVRIGSIYPGTRRNSMYLTSSEENSPYQDILVDINRPDYNVIYFTPKYKKFEAFYEDENGTYKKGVFYLQNDEFQNQVKEIKELQDSGEELSETQKTLMKNVASQYIPKTDNAAPFTGILNVKNTNLTYQPNLSSYYDENNQKIKVEVDGIEYYTSTDLNSTIITSTPSSGEQVISYEENGQSITLLLGQL